MDIPDRGLYLLSDIKMTEGQQAVVIETGCSCFE